MTMTMRMRTILLLLVSLFSGFTPSVSAADSILTSADNETVFQLVSSSNSFDLFSKLLNSTNVGPLTNGFGKVYTVFAPIDEIFIELPPPYTNYLINDASTVGSVTSLTNLWNLHAAALAQFHVIKSEELNASDIFDGTTTSLTTLLANESISVDSSTRTLGNTNATITQADVAAFNGMIQIIDQVLIPDSLYNTTVASVFQNELASNFTIFAGLLAKAEQYLVSQNTNVTFESLSELLADATESGVTLFLPSDASLKDWTAATNASAFLLVTYHIARQNVNPTPLPVEVQPFYTSYAAAAWFHAMDGKTSINLVNITNTRLAGNGVINFVDDKLLPLDVGSQLIMTSNVGGANLTDFFVWVQDNVPQFWEVHQFENFWTVMAVPDEVFLNDENTAILRRLTTLIWRVHLASVVLNHLYPASLTAVPDIVTGAEVEIGMASGYNITVQRLGDSLNVGGYECLFADLTGFNGDIEGLPALLLPPWYYNSIYNLVDGSPDFTTAINLIQQANLTYLLNETDGPLTFIVPDNAAFAEVDNLSSYSDDEVRDILMGHVFADNIFSLDLAGQTSGNGVFDRWAVTTSSDGEVFLNGGLLYIVNNLAYNGVVHAINKVLIETATPTEPTATPPTAPTATPPTAPSPSAPVGSPGASNIGATSAAPSFSSSSNNVMGRVAMVLSVIGMWLFTMA